MRIVLDGRMILPRMTGAGRYVTELARRLPGTTRDIDLTVLLTPSLKSTEVSRTLTETGIRVVYVNAHVGSPLQWLVVPIVLGRLRPDLYHYPFLDLPYVACSTVITVYDLNPLVQPDYFSRHRLVKRWISRRLIRSSVRRCRAVLAISATTRKLLEEHFPSARGKVHTVPLGVDPSLWSPRGGALGEETNAQEDLVWRRRPYFLYVGVDRPHKNLQNLIRGFHAFREKYGWGPGAGPYLFLAGVVPSSARLHTDVQGLASAPEVRCTAALDESSLIRAYRNAVALVYISTSEGFGLPILEGFAAGVPVIAGNLSSLPEVGGDAVEYCSPHDLDTISRALGRVWSDETLRESLVRRGCQRVREFSWDATARATLRVYEEVLSESARSLGNRSSTGRAMQASRGPRA